MFKKKIISIALACGLLLSSTPLFAANIILKDQPLNLNQPPLIINGSAYVPMRAIFEALGAKVDWNQSTQTAIGTKNGKAVKVTIGKEGILKNNHTLVPLRFVSESLGSKVDWDGNTRTVYIDSTRKKAPVVNHFQKAIVTKNVDGDTIEVSINGQHHKIRMIGVDTPETKHPRKGVEFFGKEASAYTAKNLAIGTVVFLQKDVSNTDKYGRLLRYVWTKQPSSDYPSVNEVKADMFNAKLVMGGYAKPYTYPPDVRYSALFNELSKVPRNNGWGLWAGGVATPPTKKPTAKPVYSAPVTSGQGLIKGNINRKGQKIYHVPGGAFYNRTIAEEYFHTEAEAQAAGYRRSKR